MSPNGPRRGAPFLFRNQPVGINGFKAITPASRIDDFEGAPAAKKLRIDQGELPNFYLPAEPGDLEQSLCIEVLRIFHKDTSRVRLGLGSTVPVAQTFRARCKVTILSNDAEPPRVMFCNSQVCEIKAFKNPGGPSHLARIHLPQPFKVPREVLQIERVDDCVFALADSYTLVVEIEGAGDPKWPPHNLVKVNNDADVFVHRMGPTRLFILYAERELFLPPNSRAAIPLQHKSASSSEACATDLVLDTAIRWTTGFSELLVKKQVDKGVRPSITCVDPDMELPAVFSGTLGAQGLNGDAHPNGYTTNGAHAIGASGFPVNGGASHQTNGETTDELDEDGDGETTPSRSLRARGASKTYNLKELSDKAQGRELSRSKYDKPGDDDKVIYSFPAEQVMYGGFTCCVCDARSDSASLLRAHFLAHPQYSFEFEHRPGKTTHLVSVSANQDMTGESTRRRIYQLGRSTKPLDLERFLDGDDSWVTSRYGPDNGALQPRSLPVRALQPRPRQTIPRGAARRPLVPHTKKPLFDPLSKRVIHPGSEVPSPICDDQWLVQKHRDHLREFDDVDKVEKEYMTEWDCFIGKLRLSSEAYIARRFVSFATKWSSWLVASEDRMVEFGLHANMLIGKCALDSDKQTVQEVVARLWEATNRPKNPAFPLPGPEPSPLKTDASRTRMRPSVCTVCGKPITRSSLLACSGNACTHPQYHVECVPLDAKLPVDRSNWRCSHCAGPI